MPNPPPPPPEKPELPENPADRRTTPRIPIKLGVRFGTADELARAVKATTKNIGLGGLCIRTRRQYERGAELELSIEIGDGEALQVSAAVAWVRPGQAIGVRFENLSPSQAKALDRILSAAKPE